MSKKVEVVKRASVIFGLLLILIGVLTYIPAFLSSGKLFGVFPMNGWQKFFHIFIGIIAVCLGLISSYASKIFFRIFFFLFLAGAIFSFVHQEHTIFGGEKRNLADTWVDLAFAVVCFYFGFGMKKKEKIVSLFIEEFAFRF